MVVFISALFSQAPDWKWAIQAGESGWDSGCDITVDSNGNSYVTGYFEGYINFGSNTLTSNGDRDVFVAKLDVNSNCLWATNAGGISYDRGFSIAIDNNGNSYVTGDFKETATFGSYSLTSSGYNDIFVAKLDSNGNWLWAAQAGGNFLDSCNALIMDDNDNIFVTGDFWETSTFGSYSLTSSGNNDIFVAKLDVNGNWLWAIQAGGSSYDYGLAIAIDNYGNSYVKGLFHYTATFGQYSLIAYGYDYNTFIAKLDANGNWLWATKAYGGIDVNYGGETIALDANGNSYTTGGFSQTATFGSRSVTGTGASDIYLAKMDTNGNWLWAITSGESNDSGTGHGISIDDYGNKYIVGGFANTLTLGSNSLTCETGDIFVAKMDTNDNWLWAVQGGESVHAINIDLVIDNLNNIFVAGDFWDIATFGNSSLISNGDRDIFVVRCGQYFSDFIADITLGYIPLTVNFSDLSANNPTAWEWDFNYDGIIDSYEQHPTYIYSQSGIYTVLLTVSDGTNTDTKINTNYITVVDAFTADFEADITSGLQPLEVQFTDLSLIDPTNWEWDFDNDGTVDSYEQNPIYLFLEEGAYTVSLTVSDGVNFDTEIKEDYIHIMGLNSDDCFVSLVTQLDNHPNPFNPATTINFSIQYNSKVDLSIFNIKGQKIKTLTNNEFTKGSHSIIWNGDDEFNNPVSSGIYYYKLNVDDKTEAVKKCLLLK